MTLHIINKSPTNDRSLLDCLHSLGTGDTILLINDAVYALCCECKVTIGLLNQLGEEKLFFLEEDIELRGIKLNQVEFDYTEINYLEFVDLTTKHNPILSWC